MNSLLVVLSVLATLVASEEVTPLDFDWTQLKSIFESPQLRSDSSDVSNGRIVGGEFASVGQFPHHVLLVLDSIYWCGGSLIKPYWVLTAAHCLIEKNKATIYSITTLNEGYYWKSEAEQMIIHEKYIHYHYNDIALIKLTVPASVTSYSNFIKLPRACNESTFDGYPSTIQGFGRYSDDSADVSSELRFVSMPIISNEICSNFFSIADTHICTDTTGGKDSCNGDSGGGLFIGDVYNSTGRVIVGLVSYGSVLCEKGDPSVYTRITSFIDWIDRNAV